MLHDALRFEICEKLCNGPKIQFLFLKKTYNIVENKMSANNRFELSY